MCAKIVDLYSGCGGFSLGAEMAGCTSVVAVDVDPTLQSAYELNFPRTDTVQASVADLNASFWKAKLGKMKIDGLIGGPPCQGFSRIGKNEKNDPRNDLVGHFYRQVKILKPKFFVMENVEGILDKGNIDILHRGIAQLSGKYKVLEPFTVCAADFGVPTTRKRVVIVGYDPCEVDPMEIEDFLPAPNIKKVSVRDAISDIPNPIPQSRGVNNFGWKKYRRISECNLSDYARNMRSAQPKGLGAPEAIIKRRLGCVSGVFETIHSRSVARRYESIEPGRRDPISKSQKLDWSGFCCTLRAGTGPERGSYQAVRPLHPKEGRVITVREAARLQGFPDWFLFHPTKWHSFRMIGNSVPPIVSKGILSKIIPNVEIDIDARAA